MNVNISGDFFLLFKYKRKRKTYFSLTPTERGVAEQRGFCNSNQISRGLVTWHCYLDNQISSKQKTWPNTTADCLKLWIKLFLCQAVFKDVNTVKLMNAIPWLD